MNQKICHFNYGRNCVNDIKKTVFILDRYLSQSNFGGKPESNSNLILVKHRLNKVGEKALIHVAYSLLLAVLSTLIVKQNLLITAKRATRQYNKDHTPNRVKNNLPFWFYLAPTPDCRGSE